MNQLPSGWEKATLGDIAKISSGGTPSRSKSEYWNGNIPWVTTAEVKFNLISDTKEKITEEGLNNSSAKLYPINTILMAMYGQGKTRGQVAKLGIPATSNQACAAIELNQNYDVDFYFQYLSNQYNDIRDMSNSGGQANLSAGIVKGIFVPIPPLSEQTKIAQILTTWDNAICTTEQLIENSEQQKKALMQTLLTGKKRLLDENGERFSGDWIPHQLKELGFAYVGLTGKTKESFGKGKPYIPYINIFNNSKIDITQFEYVDITHDERQSKVEYGDIFFTTSSETAKDVGMSSVLLHKVDELYLNSFCFGFRLNDFEYLIPEYAQFMFRSHHLREKIAVLGQGATRYNLSKSLLMELEIILPEVQEQQKIASVLTAADNEIETLKQTLSRLKAEKQALMQQLLTGKRRVVVGL